MAFGQGNNNYHNNKYFVPTRNLHLFKSKNFTSSGDEQLQQDHLIYASLNTFNSAYNKHLGKTQLAQSMTLKLINSDSLITWRKLISLILG